MIDDLEKEIVVLAELFDEFANRISPILKESVSTDKPPEPKTAESVHSLMYVRVGDLQKKVFNLRTRMSLVFEQVDLP